MSFLKWLLLLRGWASSCTALDDRVVPPDADNMQRAARISFCANPSQLGHALLDRADVLNDYQRLVRLTNKLLHRSRQPTLHTLQPTFAC
eukprot:6198183-Pleurochrysis_carterae.AAC.1